MRYDRDMSFARFRRGPGEWRGSGPFRRGFPEAFEYDDEFADEDDDFDYDAELQAAAEYDEEFEGGWDAPRAYDRGFRGGPRQERDFYPYRPERGGRADRSRAERDEREPGQFSWGDGYIGGRGYGGTNYDLTHGYRTTAATRGVNESGRVEGVPAQKREESSPATRGGYEWGEEHELMETFGPARYGYGPYHDRLQRQRRSDDDIRKDVEDTLFYDTWVDADRISVSVREGVVTLSGELKDHQEIRYATDDAWDVEGVRGLQNELRVGGGRDDRAGDVRSDARDLNTARQGQASGEKNKETPAKSRTGGKRGTTKASAKSKSGGSR